MAKVLLKKSSVSSNAPGTGDLDYGELAINYADGRLYYKNSSNQIKHFIDSDAVAAIIAAGATGLTEVVQDPTPQLGGALDTNGNNITFGDNDKAVFGAGSDLQIYHDGANSYIQDAGTGSLVIRGSDMFLRTPTDDNFLVGAGGASVTLYYNNLAKFATATDGVSVTGNIAVSGTVDGRDVAADGTKLDGIESGATADQTITAGSGLTGGGTGDVTISHSDTSTQASVNNSNGTVIQDVTLDGFGHVTGLASVDLDGRYYTETEADSRFFNVAGDTVTGDAYFNATSFWRVSAADTAAQRADARDDATNFSRLHWYGISDTGGTSNFRHAWYDGSNYINVTANSSGRLDFTGSAASMYIGSDRVFDDGYHPNADKWTTARTLSLTGAVTGSVSIDGSGNVSLATTATSDPTLTINGDASGSATFTNLGNATLTLTIADDSHNHDGRYYTETEADSRFVNVTGDTMTGLLIAENGIRVGTGDHNTAGRASITFGEGATTSDSMYIEYDGENLSGNSNAIIIGSTQAGVGDVFSVTYGGDVKVGTNSVFHDGYHPNADKWTTARTLTLNGDVSGSVSWDGSANATLTVTVSDDSHNHVISNVDGLQTALNTKAPLASPTFTGVPTAPTASAGSNTSQIATTAFVSTAVSNLVDAAPTTLNTLNELAAALGDDPNFATTITNSIGTKVAKSGDTMTGDLNISYSNGSNPYHLLLHNASNAAGVGIQFSDTSTQNSQWGAIEFYHSDAASPGSAYGTTFKITSSTGAGSAFILDTGGDYFVGSNKVFNDGYHPNADKWTTARTLSLSGDASGSVSWDGSANVTLTVTVANDSHNHSSSSGNFTVNGDLLTDEIRGRTNQDLTITAGESYSIISDGTYNDEIIRLGAESGVIVYSSTDNLTSGLNRSTTLIDAAGNMSINNGNLTVSGSVSATTKSFVIDHPTKEGMKLRHGSLEGPEDGVYVRGRLKDNNVIELPDYWLGLVHEDTITVNLTAIGKSQDLYVEDIIDNKVIISGLDNINCFYTVFAERKDVDRWAVEYED